MYRNKTWLQLKPIYKHKETQQKVGFFARDSDMHSISFPISSTVFDGATRLAAEAICNLHGGIVGL